MLRRLRTTIAETIAFLLDVPNWLDDKPTGREFERGMPRPGPGLRAPANRLPRDPG
jgi:hypothetical protein